MLRRGDVYYADLSPVVGSEQGGVRPVLIVQNDIGNRFSPTVIAAAITSKQGKNSLPTHAKLDFGMCGLPKDSVVLLEQVRTLDKRRLREHLGNVDETNMEAVDHALSVSFGLIDAPQKKAWVFVRMPDGSTEQETARREKAAHIFANGLGCKIIGTTSGTASELKKGCKEFVSVEDAFLYNRIDALVFANHTGLEKNGKCFTNWVKKISTWGVPVYSTSGCDVTALEKDYI